MGIIVTIGAALIAATIYSGSKPSGPTYMGRDGAHDAYCEHNSDYSYFECWRERAERAPKEFRGLETR